MSLFGYSHTTRGRNPSTVGSAKARRFDCDEAEAKINVLYPLMVDYANIRRVGNKMVTFRELLPYKMLRLQRNVKAKQASDFGHLMIGTQSHSPHLMMSFVLLDHSFAMAFGIPPENPPRRQLECMLPLHDR
uniref:Uncharacterized protein n=1 Tax=Coccidioides posadasii RMSCC 3488 TaxID=454284 RepID=A0A0J6FWB8_COCPO|nr:hypothetical protein CPAG_09797 [Coccidioides posadasii RMSCC 3488]